MVNNFDVRISQSFSRAGYDIWLFHRDVSNQVRVAKPILLEFGEPKSDAFLLPDPTLYLTQSGFDSLVNGIRKEMIGNGWLPKAEMLEGELKATKSHLDDMRKVAFSYLNKVDPGL